MYNYANVHVEYNVLSGTVLTQRRDEPVADIAGFIFVLRTARAAAYAVHVLVTLARILREIYPCHI